MHATEFKRRAFLAGFSAISATALLTACGGPAATGTPADGGTPVDGGNITFLIQGYDTGWVSSKTSISSYEGNLWGQLTDKLVYVDANGALSPWVAESWEELNGAKDFVIHLKDGVTFSDGTPLDAAAVVANLQAWAKGDPDRGISKVGLFPCQQLRGRRGCGREDRQSLLLLPRPGLHRHPGLPRLHPALARKTLALPVEAQADLSQEIGSGPFVVKSWKQGDSYVLEKRPDYNWGPAALGHTGPARLDTITYKVIKDTSVRTSTVASGQADVAFNVEPQEIESLKAAGLHRGHPQLPGIRGRVPGQHAGLPHQRRQRPAGHPARHRPRGNPQHRLHSRLGRGHHLHPGQRPGSRRLQQFLRLRPGQGRASCWTTPAGRPAPTVTAPRTARPSSSR